MFEGLVVLAVVLGAVAFFYAHKNHLSLKQLEQKIESKLGIKST